MGERRGWETNDFGMKARVGAGAFGLTGLQLRTKGRVGNEVLGSTLCLYLRVQCDTAKFQLSVCTAAAMNSVLE